MQKAAILDELAFASSSMDVACEAAQIDDWAKAEQALLDVQERSARLLRELGLQRESNPTAAEPASPKRPLEDS